MDRRQPLPKTWLFSDARAGSRVTELAAMLPPGSGIVLRHDGLASGVRWRLFRRLMRIARTRKLVLLLAATPALARCWGGDGVHLRQPRAGLARQAQRLGLIVSIPVHDGGEARRARRARADIAFISPLHPTRSHPGAPPLGIAAWLRLARLAGGEAVALGGMNRARARRLVGASKGSHIAPGWAAIDAWDEKAARKDARKATRRRQKRNCVPI